MSQQKRSRKKERGETPAEVMASGGAVMSVEVDAAGDRAWFRAHPLATERRRLATAAELAMSGRLPGTMIRIERGPFGSLCRIFSRRGKTQN